MSNALLILDMQNYFFASAEKRAGYSKLVASLNELIAFSDRTRGWRVVHAVSVHKADRSTWSQNMLRHDAGCLLEGSHEARLVDDLIVNKSQAIVVKTRHSAFVRTSLESDLRKAGVERVLIGGVFTHGCVALTAIDAWSLDFQVVLARDAVFSHRPEIAEFFVERLQNMFRIEMLSNEEIMSRFASPAGCPQLF
jgi:nicotinamidase-related amidase